MAIFTTILNLLKKNPVTDGADTFNIQTMMNDNWDKIDAALGMVGVRADVRAATTSNIMLSGLLTVDGVVLAGGERVLVKNQTTGSENGVYTASSGAWTRAADADSSGKIASGISVYVAEGSVNAGTGWVMSNTGVVTLGTTALTFVQKTGPGAATDAVIGKRTIDDSVAVGSTDTDTPTNLLSKMGAQLRAVTGEKDWYTPPATSLATLEDEVLASTPPTTITLKPGVNVYNASRTSRVDSIRMSGRTLVNLLGRDGNCEELSKWGVYQVSQALDSTNKTLGINSIRLTINTGFTSGSTGQIASSAFTMNAGKYYVAIVDIKNGSATNGSFYIFNGPSASKGINTITSTDKFNPAWRAYAPISTYSNCTMVFGISGIPGQTANFDGARVFEISASEYATLDGMITSQIAAMYPYVDDIKHVNAVYVDNPGRNLLPPFTEWQRINFNALIIDNYKLSHTKTGNAVAESSSSPQISVVPSTTYSLNSGGARMRIYESFDGKSYSRIKDISGKDTFITSSTTKYIIIETFLIDSEIGTFVWEDPILNIGASVQSFYPQLPSRLSLPDVNLRSNLDGTVADQLYSDGQGRPRVVRRFRETLLDGSISVSWALDNYSGFKRVKFTAAPFLEAYVAGKASLVKYDGKSIPNLDTTLNADSFALSGDGTFYVSIPAADSGWGDNFKPSAEEIKAYFNGWVMYNFATGDASQKYNDSGTKGWAYRASWYSGSPTPGNMIGGTTILPTDYAPGYGPKGYFTPYRLIYQLAQSTDEPINYEGDLVMHEGPNQIEVGTGIVVREFAQVFGDRYVNAINASPPSRTKYRPERFLTFFQNDFRDFKWVQKGPLVLNGEDYVYGEALSPINREAMYSVTYLTKERHALGIAPVNITGQCAYNLKGTVDILSSGISSVNSIISTLQSTKAQKQQPQWIAPTLLNGWVNESYFSSVGYYKDDLGIVHLRGLIKAGNTESGKVLLRLPKGYIPAASTALPVISSDGMSAYAGTLNIFTDGTLNIGFGIRNVWLSLEGLTFRTEG
ncbi:hypothetical protein [Cohnella nanjingensis]|uniref:Uncharacterized protein n=1 Tax=Cohnella nanjingensis TaxID=1387779 RepID=A0A7X0RVN5_9BACL|nr:hypothetical protein [Cohnella nanjingensis]MBB6674502.1 hypothetical protein [Cohnella nanjingensis]